MSSDEDSVSDDDSGTYYSYHEAVRMHTMRQQPYQVKSLKTSCFIKIIKRRICGAGCGHGIFSANELPNSLRNGLLKFFLGSKNAIEYVHDEECLVFNLINKDTTKVDLSNWDPSEWYSEKLEQVMEKLALHSPSLEEFACKNSGFCDREFITPPVLDNLLQLKYLTRLSIEGVWCWSNEDLVSLSQSLKKLAYLKLSLDVQVKPEVGFELFPLLEDLRYLLFKIEAADYEYDMAVYEPIYSWCAQNIPNLKEIKSGIDDFGSNKIMTLSITPTFKGTRELEILHSAYNLPRANLPNLTHLHFAGPIGDDRTLNKFSQYQNLTNLHLENVSNEDIRDICNNAGKQLKKLIISSTFDSAVDIFLIFHLCPHLVNFSLLAGELFNFSPYSERIDQRSFQSLESLTVRNLMEKQEYPAGLLNFLLHAPLIQKIKLGKIVINKEDCRLFHDIAPENFLHLTHFEMEPFVREPHDLSIVSDLGKMSKSIVCAAPKLMTISLDLSSFGNHPRIVKCWKSMKDVYDFMDILYLKSDNCSDDFTY